MSTDPREPLPRMAGLDGLRGLAIGGVMLGHLHQVRLQAAGDVGVTVFFVLSGYLITMLLVRELRLTGRVDLRSFFVRRVRRLAPAFASVLFVVMIMTLLSGIAFVTPGEVLAAVFYATNLSAWFGPERFGILHHTWSLATEEQFYLIWPLVVATLGTGRRVVAGLWVLFVAITVWRGYLLLADVPLDRVAFAPDTRADGLIIGCLLALAMARGRSFIGSAGPALIGLGVLALTPLGIMYLGGMPLVVVFSAAVIQAVQRDQAPSWLAWSPLVALGRISYGVYLWNHVLLYASDYLLGWSGRPLLTALVTIPFSIGLAAMSWRWIEQPWLRPRAASSASGSKQFEVVVPLNDGPSQAVDQRIGE